MNPVPALRIRSLNEAPAHPDRSFVLYWMTSYRRLTHNFALQRAVEWCRQLNRPLVILEALRSDYQWASDRLHAFVMEGMADQQEAAAGHPVLYYPYVEPFPGHGSGLMEELGQLACVIVSDDFPCFFLPRMLQAVARHVSAKMETVDSNGLLPMRAAATVYSKAYSFRRFLQSSLGEHLNELPHADPLRGLQGIPIAQLPQHIIHRWPATPLEMLRQPDRMLSGIPVDHSVAPAPFRGGAAAAGRQCVDFLRRRLAQYSELRNQPDEDGSSGLSPWLHFGHISVHQIFAQLVQTENWRTAHLGNVRITRGGRTGWWGMSPSAEAFLDELVTWRELGFNMCWQQRNYQQFDSLPDWALQTLDEHSRDPRPVIYDREQLQTAQTHDPLWNAAQNQLRTEGRMHNYLRMLWGKKILEWSPSPEDALAAMVELNNRFAVDGRNPNSWSGIFWVLGRYDRPWGPERPIFGKIRYMTSENTARKLRLDGYLRRYGVQRNPRTLFD